LNCSLTTGNGGCDFDAGSYDVHAVSVVAEFCELVSRIAGTDGDGIWSRGGRSLAGVLVLITSGDDEGDAGRDGASDDLVFGSAVGTTEGHVDDGGSLLLLGLLGYPGDGLKDALAVSTSVTAHALDCDERDLASDSVGVGADGACHVSAVTFTIFVPSITGGVDSPTGSTSKLRVADIDS